MGGGVSTDFKSSNRIEISWLVQVLLNFEWFQGSPLGGGRGEWMGVGVVRGCTPPMCTHMCMHACAHDIIGNSRDFPKSNGGSHLHEIIMFTMHACMCMCVHVCGGTPQLTPHPHTPTRTPRDAGSPKHQNSISLELIKIIQFCLKILYLWTFLNSYRL